MESPDINSFDTFLKFPKKVYSEEDLSGAVYMAFNEGSVCKFDLKGDF